MRAFQRIATLFLLSIIVSTSADAAPIRPLKTVRELKVLTYNVENLFLRVGRFERLSAGEFRKLAGSDPKSPEACEGVAKVVRDLDADIVAVQEVEGLDALNKFNKDYLGSGYHSLLIEGNDERGIDVGFMVKRDLPLQIVIESHKDMTWKDPSDGQIQKLFSRDVPALILRRANESTSAKPLLIVLGNHAKSKRDRNNDPLSENLRRAQYVGMAKIIDGYRKQYGADVPMMIAGDFNTTVPTSASVKPIHDRMEDAFDVKGLRGDERVTHTFHPHGGRTEYNQLDAIFVNPALSSSVLEARVYRYKDSSGRELPLPNTYDKRSENPSDHFPIIVKVSTKLIFPEAFGVRQYQPSRGRPQPRGSELAAGF